MSHFCMDNLDADTAARLSRLREAVYAACRDERFGCRQAREAAARAVIACYPRLAEIVIVREGLRCVKHSG